jgi:dihydroxyacid dehydratase/phosphogluconate dehydratase
MTVTGRTLAENLQTSRTIPSTGRRRRFDHPIKKDSHLVILGGNLAPDGAVAKISGKEGESSPARRACSIAKRMRSPRFSPAASRKATSS